MMSITINHDPRNSEHLRRNTKAIFAKGYHGKSENVGDADMVQDRMTAKLNLNDGGREDDIAVVAAAASLDSFDSRVSSLGLFCFSSAFLFFFFEVFVISVVDFSLFNYTFS